jgi:glycine cleavage system H protein
MAELKNCMLPDELLYHVAFNVWIHKNDDGTLDLGMTDIAQSMAGNIIHCRPKKVGQKSKAGKSVATVESGKWVGPVKTPFSGEIVATNNDVENDATIVNRSPYKQGGSFGYNRMILMVIQVHWSMEKLLFPDLKLIWLKRIWGECVHCEGFEG